ncbi:MAG: DUF4339 domain-containing protein [Solobacterium sp.]|nr:DUF4339 domain-containing protein [Solobacterium sp.]
MNKFWYYTKDGEEKYGPYTDNELIRLIKEKIIREEDKIWMVDLDEWLTLGDSIFNIFIPEDNEEKTLS